MAQNLLKIWAQSDLLGIFTTISLIITRNCKRDGECEGLEGQFLCSNGLCHNMTRVVDCQYNITGELRCFGQDRSLQIFCRGVLGLQRQTQLHHPGGDAPVHRGHLSHPRVALQLHKVPSWWRFHWSRWKQVIFVPAMFRLCSIYALSSFELCFVTCVPSERLRRQK